VGFGIRTPEQAHDIASIADGAVVGSVLVEAVAQNLDAQGKALPELVDHVLLLASQLAAGVNKT
jgi:tryptophan synthase alpha chain